MPKLIKATNREDYVPEKKRYSKPKVYIPGLIEEYWKERDRLWYSGKVKCSPETILAIKERYNV